MLDSSQLFRDSLRDLVGGGGLDVLGLQSDTVEVLETNSSELMSFQAIDLMFRRFATPADVE